MVITLQHYLILSAVLFAIGIAGALTRKSMLVMLMSIELMLVAANISFVAFARWGLLPEGQIAALFVLALAAAGVAVGLGIMVAAYRNTPTVNMDEFTALKG